MTRRRYEGLALIAADGTLEGDKFRPLRRGLLNNDTAVSEFALEAIAKLADSRFVPLLKRLDDGVPDWTSQPAHCPTNQPDFPSTDLENLCSPREPTTTASDVLDQLE